MTQLTRESTSLPTYEVDVLAHGRRTALVLGGIVAIATALHAGLALRSPSPWIVPDELIYSELAKSLAEGGPPKIRGEISFDWGVGYPVLLAPIWALIDDISTAYAVAKVWNAVILASTAVPAYFLARRFAPGWPSVVAAGLSVAIPPMLYAGTLMTEVALYPAFVTAVLAITVAVDRPTAGTQLGALAVITLAYAIKSVALVLVAVYVCAVGLHWVLDRDKANGGRQLRAYVPTWVSVGAGMVLAGAFVFGSGKAPQDVLGSYANVVEHMRLAEVPRWILIHLAELDLAVAVIPLAATALVLARGIGRNASREERLFAAVAIPTVVVWLFAVGSFASVPFLKVFEYPENVNRLQGRSTFMLAPLLFIGFVMWLRDRRGSARLVVGASAAAALMPVVIPLGELDANVRFQAMSLVPWVELRGHVGWPIGLLVVTSALGAMLVLASRTRVASSAVVATVAVWFSIVALAAHDSMLAASEWTSRASAGDSLTWIDDAFDKDAEVSVLWAEPAGIGFVDLDRRHRVLFTGEFFNRAVGNIYEVGSSLPYNLPSSAVRLKGGAINLADGRPAHLGRFVLVPCHVRVAGRVHAADSTTGAKVVEVRRPQRVTFEEPGRCGQR